MNILGIIPARYASSRFPGKPLADINGKSMLMRVYEQSSKAFAHVYVATDDKKIFEHVKLFGGNVVITSNTHKSGTDRCAEAFDIISKELNKQFDVVVNIQGDEPFVKPEQLNLLVSLFKNSDTQISTLIKKITKIEDIFDKNKPKVVFNKYNQAIYFSRLPIPFLKNIPENEWLQKGNFYKHIGLYAYKASVLQEITKLKSSFLENSESLEQLRWLENGYKISVEITEIETISVDTPEDLEKAILFGR
ncbi:MAG: 3-deoxy-manno-octulosonate cytidylyltransferase [Bacteroidetes bacterium GWA2_32_17]|nr:MAG: 3-deoxy-manno-octulosonate cytidylyltransferase [Bacteroidetes bacterium GWA2_32_17]